MAYMNLDHNFRTPLDGLWSLDRGGGFVRKCDLAMDKNQRINRMK